MQFELELAQAFLLLEKGLHTNLAAAAAAGGGPRRREQEEKDVQLGVEVPQILPLDKEIQTGGARCAGLVGGGEEGTQNAATIADSQKRTPRGYHR